MDGVMADTILMNKINIKEIKDKSKVLRDSIGGYPILAGEQEIPSCKICNKKMVLFFQLDLQERFNLPFKPGSHLSFFMCREHDEPVWWGKEPLPENYMESEHYRLILNPPGKKEIIYELDTKLIYSEIQFKETKETVKTVGPKNERFQIG